MENIRKLLDAVLVAKGLSNKSDLAKELDVNKARISAYYSGKETPTEFVCLKIAEATGRSYEEVSAIVRIEAEKDENRRKVWKDYLKRIGGIAACIMLFFLAVNLKVTPTTLQASNGKDSAAQYFVLCKLSSLFKTVAAIVQRALSIAFPRFCYAD